MADLRLEVDRFDWASEERLELVGADHGLRLLAAGALVVLVPVVVVLILLSLL